MIAARTADLNLLQPESGAAEQDPDELFDQALACLAGCVSDVRDAGYSEIAAVSVSSILGSVIPLSADGSPLGNALTWADLRCSTDARDAKSALDEDDLYRDTGCQIHSFYVGPKIAWLRRCRSSVFREAAHFVPTKGYLVKGLTGELLIDRSVASGSGLLMLDDPIWNTDWGEYLDIESARLGEVVEPFTTLKLLPEISRGIGLPVGTPLIIGGSDGTLSSLGVGALQRGQYAAMLATSGAFRTVRRQHALHPQNKTWAYYLADGLWVCGTAVSSGGIAYRWVRDTFFGGEASELTASGGDGYDVVNAAAASVPRGAGGLLVLPYLSGERSPNWNVDARGILAGLNLSHDRRHIARAVMEGISIHFAQAAAALMEVCGPPTEIRATGGFRKSDLWTQIMAEALGHKLSLPPNVDASCLGAALLAMRASGVFGSLFDAAKLVPIEGEVVPDPAGVKQYADLSDLHQRVYESLRPDFGEIASTANSGD